ncbi:hypothetical protein [Halomarina litorea]|uniref:hypothetical protein n=1 Tax=Halomarina litorea TaxID=2961595 RepID=UPI0020C40054|nr:hypothetical protein [Halomarina sp. BCD28]
MAPPPTAPLRNPHSNEQMREPRRPDPTPDTTPPGITLACLVRLAVVALGVSAGFDLLAGSTSLLGGALLVVSAVELPVVWGLWRLRAWAWRTALALYAVALVVTVAAGLLVVPALTALVAGYVYSKRGAYRRERPAAESRR